VALSPTQQTWYRTRIAELDPTSDVVQIDVGAGLVSYSPEIKSDESHTKPLTPEEYVHALTAVMLVKELGYPVDRLYHERHIEHGSAGSNADEVDFIILDDDGRPYAVWELKSSEAYSGDLELATKSQLFGTVPLLTEGAPTFIVCATIDPNGHKPELKQRCIDYREHKDYQTWIDEGKPTVPAFPRQYWEPDYQPYVRGGTRDLKTTCTLSEFRAVAESFHNEFFSEHPDNQLFEYIVKCLLAKIHSEKNTHTGEPYQFQVFLPHGKPESAAEVANRVNQLYVSAHKHYIEPNGSDEIDQTRFAPERIKSVVQQLEGMALTKGSALNADIIGAFFEEILRSGFKQDRGMYFTHDNIARFMVEAVGLRDLTRSKWKRATHPDNRLPYVIDPACGSGTFLLHSMHTITDLVTSDRSWFSKTDNDEIFLGQNFNANAPNGWAKDFLYGLDPKFIMAITAKLNMVLHGDGVAHLFKDDAYRPMDAYNDGRLRPVGTADRSLTANVYPPAMCEMFDVVISNPPFGVTLATETRQTLSRAFTLPATYSTEALFIERAFQLLRPGGRLAVVLPESVLNAADTGLRLFLMRMFHIRAVVTMPRHIFVDTPTLTSLLFAQKKTGAEVAEWDRTWGEEAARIEAQVAVARRHLTVGGRRAFGSPADLEAAMLGDLAVVGGRGAWVMRRGQQNGGPLGFGLPDDTESVADGVRHYQALLQAPGFQDLVSQAVFSAVAGRLDTDWLCYAVSEVGFKLSKRGERIRENQLARFVGQSGIEVPNLHLAAEPASVVVDRDQPSTVLDFMSLDVAWT
jgi:type I restriction enzyme M protein